MTFKTPLLVAMTLLGTTLGAAAAHAQDYSPSAPMVPVPADAAAAPVAASGIQTIPGMPPVIDPKNIYSETTPSHISPAIAQDPARVYVPNLRGDSVSVIDPASFRLWTRSRSAIRRSMWCRPGTCGRFG